MHKLIAQCVQFIWVKYRIFYLPTFPTYYNCSSEGATNAVNMFLLWHRPILCYHVCEDAKIPATYEVIVWVLSNQYNAVGATYLLDFDLYIFYWNTYVGHLVNNKHYTDISNLLINPINPFWLLLVLFEKKCKKITWYNSFPFLKFTQVVTYNNQITKGCLVSVHELKEIHTGSRFFLLHNVPALPLVAAWI